MAAGSLVGLVLSITSTIAVPFLQAETLILWALQLNTLTSFRMFPPPDIVPDIYVPILMPAVHTVPLLFLLYIPRFVRTDRWDERRATLSAVLRPLTRRGSLSLAYLVMFARVWLFMACLNSALFGLLIDPVPHTIWVSLLKIPIMWFIL